MSHDRIWRGLRVALLAATVSLLFGSVAWGPSWGRDGDNRYDRRDGASDQGYRNGYGDGLRVGQSDAERGRRFKIQERRLGRFPRLPPGIQFQRLSPRP
jgi:hypothetical protein